MLLMDMLRPLRLVGCRPVLSAAGRAAPRLLWMALWTVLWWRALSASLSHLLRRCASPFRVRAVLPAAAHAVLSRAFVRVFPPSLCGCVFVAAFSTLLRCAALMSGAVAPTPAAAQAVSPSRLLCTVLALCSQG